MRFLAAFLSGKKFVILLIGCWAYAAHELVQEHEKTNTVIMKETDEGKASPPDLTH